MASLIPSCFRVALPTMVVLGGCGVTHGLHQAWHGARLRLDRVPLERAGLAGEAAAAGALVPVIQAHGLSLGLKPTRAHRHLLRGVDWEPQVLLSCSPLSLTPDSRGGLFGQKTAWELHFTPRSLMREVRRREARGREVHHRAAGAWTSRGIGADPLLPSALDAAPGDLAEMVLHEQVHHTLWMAREPVLAESVAGFLGQAAARDFLVVHYGQQSEVLRRHDREQAERRRWASLLAALSAELETALTDNTTTEATKHRERARLISSLHRRVEEAGFEDSTRFHAAVRAGGWTTARLAEHRAYRGAAVPFDALLEARNGDLGQLIADLRAWERAGQLGRCLAEADPCATPPRP